MCHQTIPFSSEGAGPLKLHVQDIVTHYITMGSLKYTTVSLCHDLFNGDVIVQVLVVALLTALVQYPNPYTRFNASQVIRKLFSQCGPEDAGDLWSVT